MQLFQNVTSGGQNKQFEEGAFCKWPHILMIIMICCNIVMLVRSLWIYPNECAKLNSLCYVKLWPQCVTENTTQHSPRQKGCTYASVLLIKRNTSKSDDECFHRCKPLNGLNKDLSLHFVPNSSLRKAGALLMSERPSEARPRAVRPEGRSAKKRAPACASTP